MYLSLHPQHCHVYFNFRKPCARTRTKQNQACKGVVSVSWRGSKSERREIEARDRVIDFGKYKGKMLGSLPSSYLKWVSKNLRAGDSEEWAKLADQVLRDPIYRDRIEWEFALNVLNGNSRQPRGGAVSELEEISQRFGWDNLDKIGWGKLHFDLLGTSKGGRIPRLVNPNLNQPKQQRVRVRDNHIPEPSSSSSSRRAERRERRKLRTPEVDARADQHQPNNNFNSEQQQQQQQQQHVNNANPFPGRRALLRRAINHRTTQTQPPPLQHSFPTLSDDHQLLGVSPPDEEFFTHDHDRNSSSYSRRLVIITSLSFLAAATVIAASVATAADAIRDPETLSNIPQTLSSGDCKKPKIQKPKSRKAESCTVKCVNTCIRGGEGEGPLNVRRPLVVFKQGFRSRQYW